MEIRNLFVTLGRWLLELVLFLLFCVAIAALGFIAFAPPAQAQTPDPLVARVTWVPPTTYIDNVPLGADLLEYVVEWRRPIGGTLVGSQRVPAPANGVDIPGLICGNYDFVVLAVTKPTAVYPNTTSQPSNTATKVTGVACVPKAPTQVGVS